MRSYGLSVTTMEEVFLNVSRAATTATALRKEEADGEEQVCAACGLLHSSTDTGTLERCEESILGGAAGASVTAQYCQHTVTTLGDATTQIGWVPR